MKNLLPIKLPLPKPIKEKNVIRLLLVLVIILAIVSGYFQALYKQERKRYLRLEDKYVRVRGQLGREKMQELIDRSHSSN